jgi:uncharacterized membrane protein
MGSPPALPDHVHDNIASIARLREQVEREQSSHQRRIEAAARVLGRPATLYTLVTLVVGWIGLNAYLLHAGRQPLDPPPFFWLQGAIALYAALVATMVLITQARQAHAANRRSHLEFHFNLLTEQKTTKIISLLEELRRDLPNVRDRRDSLADELQEEIDPHVVHSALTE